MELVPRKHTKCGITGHLHNVEPYAYLKATLEAIAAGHPAARIDELMPWNYPLNPRTERLASNHE